MAAFVLHVVNASASGSLLEIGVPSQQVRCAISESPPNFRKAAKTSFQLKCHTGRLQIQRCDQKFFGRRVFSRPCSAVILAPENGFNIPNQIFAQLADLSLVSGGSLAAEPKPDSLNGKSAPLVASPTSPDMSCRTPIDMYTAAVEAGIKKSTLPKLKTFVLGMMAGAYIGIASQLVVMLSGSVPAMAAANPGLAKTLGCIFFPFGLLLVILNGAEMYTANTMFMSVPLLAGKVSPRAVFRNWQWSWLGNLVGSVLVAAAAFSAGMLDMPSVTAAIKGIATAKTSLPLLPMFLRAVIANWLVCSASYLQLAAKDPVGKLMYIWFPVFAFIAMTTEHSVANMFLIPAGMFAGANVSLAALFRNLVVVSLGNLVGGFGVVGALAHFLHGKRKPAPQQH